MKVLTIVLCTLFITPAFAEVKELLCEIEFGEHTTKVADKSKYTKGINYTKEEKSVSHAGYTCQCQWTVTDFAKPYLTTVLTLPSGASIKANSGAENYQYVTETQANVACRGISVIDY